MPMWNRVNFGIDLAFLGPNGLIKQPNLFGNFQVVQPPQHVTFSVLPYFRSMSVRPEFFISLQRTINISYDRCMEERLRELSRIGVGGRRTAYSGGTDHMQWGDGQTTLVGRMQGYIFLHDFLLSSCGDRRKFVIFFL